MELIFQSIDFISTIIIYVWFPTSSISTHIPRTISLLVKQKSHMLNFLLLDHITLLITCGPQGGDSAHQSCKARYPSQGGLQHGCQERKIVAG